MKKIVIFLCLLFAIVPLFAYDFSALEKRIMAADPEEMRRIVLDRSLESELNAIFKRIEAIGDTPEDITDACKTVFPGLTDEEYLLMLVKLILIAALGSGDYKTVTECSELFVSLTQFEAMLELMEPTEETPAFFNNRYWEDCIGFAALFDYDSFIAERFGED